MSSAASRIQSTSAASAASASTTSTSPSSSTSSLQASAGGSSSDSKSPLKKNRSQNRRSRGKQAEAAKENMTAANNANDNDTEVSGEGAGNAQGPQAISAKMLSCDDEAIVAVGEVGAEAFPKSPAPFISYTASDLRKIREEVAFCKRWPHYLDEAFKNQRGQWDPDRWHQNKKRGLSPVGDAKGSGADRPTSSLSNEGKRRDAKDRLKAELQDGLVLSPQRRSFLTGCQVASHPDEAEHAGVKERGGTGPAEEISLRPEAVQNRRIGSGRILSRQADREEFPVGPGGDRRGGAYEREHRRPDERFGRYRDDQDPADRLRRDRSRDKDRKTDRWGHDREEAYRDEDGFSRRGGLMARGGRGGERMGAALGRGGLGSGRMQRHEREPEWMSETVEQGELMELHGFYDAPDEPTPAMQARVAKEKAKVASKPREQQPPAAKTGHSAPQSNGTFEAGKADLKEATNANAGFNLDEFLHMDTIPGLAQILNDQGADLRGGMAMGNELVSDGAAGAPTQGSRFSQFFKRGPQMDALTGKEDEASRRSSIHDELQQLSRAEGLRGMTEQPSIRIPSPGEEGNFYFAPISPAAQTASRHSPTHSANKANPVDNRVDNRTSLMELLKGGGRQKGEENSAVLSMGAPLAFKQLQGKNVRSVEELEADFQQMELGPQSTSNARLEMKQPPQHSFPNQQHPREFARGPPERPDLEQRRLTPEEDSDMSAFRKFAAMVQQHSDNSEDGFYPNRRDDLEYKFQMANRQQMGPPQMHGHHPEASFRPSGHPRDQDSFRGGFYRGAQPPPQPRPPRHFQQPDLRIPGPVIQHQPDLLQLIHSAPLDMDMLQRPEAHALQLAVTQGQVMPQSLLQQFTHGNLPNLQREILLQVLKVQQGQGRLPTSMPPPPQPQPPPPSQQQLQAPFTQHMAMSPSTSPLNEQLNLAMLQQQQRRTTPNNLAISPTPGQQRIPSPQELVFHTQQIMQNALIKRKLEEQKENYRRRQELPSQPPLPQPMPQQMYPQPRERSNSNPRKPNRPETDSPLNFTPTSVIKKVVADRRDSDVKPSVPELRVSSQTPSELALMGTGLDSMRAANPLSPTSMAMRGMIPPGSGIIPPPVTGLPQNHPLLVMQQQQQMLHMAALRGAAAAAGARMPPDSKLLPQQQQPPHFARDMPQQQPMLQPFRPGGPVGPMGPGGDLSRFFSPEVLAQAQAAGASNLPPLPTQQALTLEELERAAAVKI